MQWLRALTQFRQQKEDVWRLRRERFNGIGPTNGVGGGTRGHRNLAGLTDQTLSCAARAHVATAARRTACLHVSRAMQAARRRSVLTSRAGSARGAKTGRERGDGGV